MIYNQNYRDQFFWDQPGKPSISQLFGMVKSELSTPRVKRPSNPVTKVSLVSLGIGALIVALSALLSYALTKSILFMIIIIMVTAFIFMGASFIVIAVYNFFIYGRRCTVSTPATCIGYSISGSSNNNSGGARLLRSPVFKYTYGGLEYIAFDDVYESGGNVPPMNVETTILVDPSDPSHIKWDFSNRKAVWIIAGGAIFILMAFGLLFLCLSDDDFREAALPQTAQTQTIHQPANQ